MATLLAVALAHLAQKPGVLSKPNILHILLDE